ncbi:MAG: YdjY domain-containing protein [Phycisphaerales bacterium JB050]
MKPSTLATVLSAGIWLGIGSTAAYDPVQPTETSPQPEATSDDGGRKLFPHVRINTQDRWLELDGFVPIDVNDPDAPLVYLEQFVCARESPEIAASKEHESLVSTNAKASHIHAGLLLLNLEPGSPTKWRTEEDGSITAIDPTGSELRVEFIWTDEDGQTHSVKPQDWVRHFETKERFPEGHWVFSGSKFVDYGRGEVYDADHSGLIVGLTSFGGEVVSWHSAIHHDSGVATPVWSANNDTVPKFKTPVRVRLYAVDHPEPEPDSSPSAEDQTESESAGPKGR